VECPHALAVAVFSPPEMQQLFGLLVAVNQAQEELPL
jgi:hypothetical protein